MLSRALFCDIALTKGLDIARLYRGVNREIAYESDVAPNHVNSITLLSVGNAHEVYILF